MERSFFLKRALFIGCMALAASVQATSQLSSSVLVFVHGAHLTADAWQRVQSDLNAQGHPSIAVNLPGRKDNINPKHITLDSSAQALCKSVSSLNKPVTFVSHSQGGAIVNHALSICPQIKVDRIIYLAAVAPLAGEKPFDKLSELDEKNYYKGVVFHKSSGLMIIKSQRHFIETFSSNENYTFRQPILRSAVNEPAYIADGIVKFEQEKFSDIKKFYIFTEQDRIISKSSQVNIEKQLNSVKTASIASGHLPMITNPENLVNVLLDFMAIN